ncbi:MAG: AmmeMemoRadiSam system protein B [Alphaproteobacteria bacterium]
MAKMKIKEPEVDVEKKVVKYTIISVFLILLGIFNYFVLSDILGSNDSYINNYEEEKVVAVREPAVAGIFYAADRKKLDETVEHYLKTSDNETILPKLMIVPHAGYQYSGYVAGKAYAILKKYADEIKTVIIVGPSHHTNLYGAAMPQYEQFKTPLGSVKVDTELAKEIAQKPRFKIANLAHNKEHSIEVQIPFLQKVLNNFKIVPVAYGAITSEELAFGLAPYLNRKDTIIIFSADLSHYNHYETAQKMDAYTEQMIMNKEAEVSNELSCGATGINTALILANQNNLYPETIEMLNSGDITGDKENVVGYGAWNFSIREPKKEMVYKGIDTELKSLQEYTEKYGQELLSIAKISLEDAVLREEKFRPSRKDYSEALFDKGASFVTIEKNGELRGCVGTIIPYQAVSLDVASSAFNAAREDKRFDKVSNNELTNIKITISLLTNLERIRYVDEKDLLSKIEQNSDGIVIREGDRQGLFLPSVWKEFKTTKEFLDALKLKTGMSPSYWSNRIKVYRFKTVEVKENEN